MMSTFCRVLAMLAPTCAILAAAPQDRPDSPEGAHPELAFFDFETDGSKGWDFTDKAAWRIAEQPMGGHALNQFQASKYEPKVRSPFNIALAPGVDVADLDVTLKVKSTARDYGHRDVCIVFGYQDPSHFYYVHFGKKADAAAHSIFIVNDAPRVSIAEKRTDGTPWTDAWHTVRVTRRARDGEIQVYFDDLKTPIMTAHDRTFRHGRIGVGTFDDTGLFDDIRVRGATPPAAK